MVRCGRAGSARVTTSHPAALKNLAGKKLEIERGQFGDQQIQSWLLSKGLTQEKVKSMGTADFEKTVLSEVSKTKDPRLQAKILDTFGLSGLKPAILGHSPEEIQKTIEERQKACLSSSSLSPPMPPRWSGAAGSRCCWPASSRS